MRIEIMDIGIMRIGMKSTRDQLRNDRLRMQMQKMEKYDRLAGFPPATGKIGVEGLAKKVPAA